MGRRGTDMSEIGGRILQHVPARDIPIPTSVSPAAQAILAMPRREGPPYPPLDDLEGWRHYAAMINEAMLPVFKARAGAVDAAVEDRETNGVRFYDVRPRAVPADDRHI